MGAIVINDNSDLKRTLEELWTRPLGLEATQDLHEGVLLEQYYEHTFVAHARKTAEGWEVGEGKSPKLPTMRIFYSGDSLDRLMETTDLEEFANRLQDMVGDRNIVFIPLRSPEKLGEAGFAEFAERLGLPGK